MKSARSSQSKGVFPSKQYSKYKSQSKTNPLLTRLRQDAGYPQDIFNQRNTININNFGTTDKNYLQLNKMNLKNFFADRLPQQNLHIFKQDFNMDPSKLFQIRKKQYQLKASTRQKLQQKLSTQHTYSTKINPNKISQIFFLNDKNEDFKKKFLGNKTVRVSTPYQQNNHLRGTASTSKKYVNITKKEAYNSVFGIQPSATTRNFYRQNIQNQKHSRPMTYHTNRNKKPINVTSKSKQLQRKKFSSYIEKLDKHRQYLDPENRFGFRPYNVPGQLDDNEAIKTDMITWIKDTTKRYKLNSIDMFSQRLQDISDVSKIDQKFYQQMMNHKTRRYLNRSTYVQNVPIKKQSSVSKNQKQAMPTGYLSTRKQNTENISISSQSQDQYSISSSQESDDDDDDNKKRTALVLLKKFAKALVDALQQARYYGIQNKNNIYKAFYKNPEPYEKSGSYAFFKAIKRGDLQAVKTFLANDPDYVYQRDHKKRSALIYATLNNHTDVIKHILKCDVNVNQRGQNYKTSLYYAIKNENIEIVKKLLQSGAIPWSYKGCCYKKILDQINNQKINTLLKNARRIYIALKMRVGRTQKMNLWNMFKQKIDENYLIS